VSPADGLEENDNLFDPSLLFSTDLILVTNLLNPFFSPEPSGPPLAGVLMIAVLN
jgi:hypothetical protein